MVFSSLIFVFVFLTLNLLSQVLIPTVRGKNLAMLVFSLVFYAWAGPRYLVLLLGMTAICWFGALRIDGTEEQGDSKRLLIITVALCLAILGVFKYTGFVLGSLNALTGLPPVVPSIALPVGISFYTFQLISYVVDVYRGEVRAQKRYSVVLMYAGLFHQCVAGPIVRYQDIEKDIFTRSPSLQEISAGISRFCVGLAKKAILANGCAIIADGFFEVTAEELAALPAAGVLLGIFAYTLQIYLDFSAYSDMAIGMGLMCGFHYKENFNYPYISQSIAEFWKRWHISLGSFFRDYVYIPLGGSRCELPRQLLNLFIVWFLTGLWHGASWNFVFWGLFFGILLGIERYVIRGRFDHFPRVPRTAVTFLLVLFSMIFFRFTDFTMLRTALGGLFNLHGAGITGYAVGLTLRNNIFFLIISTLACTPLMYYVRNIPKNLSRSGGVWFWINNVWQAAHPVLLLILSAMALAGDSYNPFLYFQF